MRKEQWIGDVHGYRYEAHNPAYALVIAHGTGGHGGAYDVFCEPLAKLGVDILSIDLPGHGLARNPSGNWRFSQWLEEVDKAARFMKEQTGLPVFVLGSSKASAVAFHSLDFSDAVDGAVTMGLFLTEVPPHADTGLGQTLLAFQTEEARKVAEQEGDERRISIETLFDWNRAYALNDSNVLEKKKTDPLRTWSWGFASEYSYMNYKPRIPASENSKPVLVTVGDLDPLMTPAYVKSCFERIGGPKELIVVPEAGHQLMTYYTSTYVPLVHRWCSSQSLRLVRP